MHIFSSNLRPTRSFLQLLDIWSKQEGICLVCVQPYLWPWTTSSPKSSIWCDHQPPIIRGEGYFYVHIFSWQINYLFRDHSSILSPMKTVNLKAPGLAFLPNLENNWNLCISNIMTDYMCSHRNPWVPILPCYRDYSIFNSDAAYLVKFCWFTGCVLFYYIHYCTCNNSSSSSIWVWYVNQT